MNYLSRVLGNESTRNRIGRAISAGKLPHALLIDGDEGTGKFTLATEIAAALNCESHSDLLPCGVCNNCRRIYIGEHVDVRVLKRQDGKATIGVAEIKDWRRDMFLSSTEAPFKVYIICEAERMTPEAQNALLIVLEEPPKNVVIILLASGTDRILTTIKSRSQYISMARFSKEETREHLLSLSPHARRLAAEDGESLDVILTEADGVLGRAIALSDPEKVEELIEERKMITDVIEALGERAEYSRIMSAIGALPEKRQELSYAIELIISAIGDMIASKNTKNAKAVFFKDMDEAASLSHGMSTRYLVSVYEIFKDALDKLGKNAGRKLFGCFLTVLAQRKCFIPCCLFSLLELLL